MAVNWRTGRPGLGTVIGGLSGPAIKPVALRMVWDVSRSVDIPVIGIGGIMNADDALEFLCAGASAVQVGTAHYRTPDAIPRMLVALREALAAAGRAEVRSVIKTLRTA
jgi:dihydroorotate dehydrogenase (NAD+) catalytic subunit